MYGVNYFSQSTDKYDYEQMEREVIEQPIFTTKDLGRTIVDGRGNGNLLQAAGAALREGSLVMEFQPGSPGEPGVSAESIGKEVRRQTKELLRLNDAKIQSIHAPPNVVGNVSGWDGRQGFSKQHKKNSIQEVKKHIDLAADLQGGAIIFHTNEFPRSRWDQFGREHAQHSDADFYPVLEDKNQGEEDQRDTVFFVDGKSGKIIRQFESGDSIRVVKDREDGKSWVESYSEALKSGNFADVELFHPEIEERNIMHYEEAFSGKNSGKEKKRYQNKINKYAEIAGMKEFMIKDNEVDKVITPQKAILIDLFENNFSQSTSTIERYSEELKKRIFQRENLRERIDAAKKIEQKAVDGGDPREIHLLKKQDAYGRTMWTSEIMGEEERIINGEIAHVREAIERSSKETQELFRYFNEVKTAEDYGLDQSTDSLAELGYHAYKRTKEQQSRGENLERPIYVAPENIFPEGGFGSHLSELRLLVEEGRKKLKERLVSEGHSESKAAKIASHSIRATLDTQHLGMWKAHFKPRPGETHEDTEKRFDEWYMDQVKKLAEADIIGNMHIVDGFTGHTHVAIGEGSLPVVNAVNAVKNLTKGPLSLNSESYEDKLGNNILIQQNIWRAFDVPLRRTNADAGIQFIDAQGTWNTYGTERMSSRGTTFNAGKGVPEMEPWKNWDGLPLE